MRTRSLLQPRIGAVLALVERAHWGDTEGVHDFRVASRSLRAALRTLAKGREGRLVRKTRRSLGRATRALADPRDRDVGRALLSKRDSQTVAQRAFKRRVIGISESERRLALTKCAAEWPRDLNRLLIRLFDRGDTSVDTVIRRSRAEAWSERRGAIDLLEALGRRFDAVGLHDMRKSVRSLRYAIEVLAEVDSTARARVIRLKPLQSTLGSIQDHIVLSRWLASQASRFRKKDPRLSASLRRESARFKAQAMRAHKAFLALKPANILKNLALHVDPHAEAPAEGKRERLHPARTARARRRQ